MTGEKTSEIQRVRDAAQITLARVSNFKDLRAETEEVGDRKFIQKTRELWKEFAVHGILGVDKKTGEKTILNFTDLDGRCCLGLLRLAGINTENIKYVSPSQFISGRINLDTGDRHGVVIEEGGKTAFFDHHSDKSGKDASATKITYEVLVGLGLLKKEAALDKLVEFVTQIDNKTHSFKKFFDKSWRTVWGLQRFIQFKPLLNYFRSGRSPDEILPDEELQRLGARERSYEQAATVGKSLKELDRMGEEGFIVESERYEKIAVDIGKKIPAGADAAFAYGCGGYIIWSSERKSFFITTTNPLANEFSQGMKVRETMWIKPEHDSAPLTITLGEILHQLTDGKLQPTGKLEEYLEEEAKNKTV